MIAIRPANGDDASACCAIYAPFVTDNWVSFELAVPTPAEMAKRIVDCQSSHGWFIAEIDGQLAGYAYGSPHRTREAYQTSCDVAVYVDPQHARKGVGRRLYGSLLPHLCERGFHGAFAGIALPNSGSIALHESCGFTPVGIYREVGWKMGGWRDVGWWQTLL